VGLDFDYPFGELLMQKAARISLRIPASTDSSRKADIASSDTNSLIAIAIFSGIGLLVSLVAVVAGVSGAWY
jgi:hypothetical protein